MRGVLKSLMTDIIVLWKNPVNDGFGDTVFDPPIEIKGRWQWRRDYLVDNNIDQQSSRATIYTMDDVEKENWVYLGKISDLTPEQRVNPKLIGEAYVVMQINAYKRLREQKYLYKRIYLE